MKEGLGPEGGVGEKQFDKLKAEFEPLTKLMAEVLGENVEKGVVYSRTAVCPCAVTTSEHGRSPGGNMKAWALRDSSMTSHLGLKMI